MNDDFIKSYVAYFEKLAREHKMIAHSESNRSFFVMDINEVLGAAADSSLRYPALILNALSMRITGTNPDNSFESVLGGFIVIDHCDKVDDYNQVISAMARSRNIGYDILQRMHYDAKICEPLAIKVLTDFSITNVTAKMWGPVFDNDFGFHFEFPLNQLFELKYDPTNWQTDL